MDVGAGGPEYDHYPGMPSSSLDHVGPFNRENPHESTGLRGCGMLDIWGANREYRVVLTRVNLSPRLTQVLQFKSEMHAVKEVDVYYQLPGGKRSDDTIEQKSDDTMEQKIAEC